MVSGRCFMVPNLRSPEPHGSKPNFPCTAREPVISICPLRSERINTMGYILQVCYIRGDVTDVVAILTVDLLFSTLHRRPWQAKFVVAPWSWPVLHRPSVAERQGSAVHMKEHMYVMWRCLWLPGGGTRKPGRHMASCCWCCTTCGGW